MGLGAHLLEHIFDSARPCLAISLSDDCGIFAIPSWVPTVLRIYPNFISLSHEKLRKKPTRLLSSQLRDVAFISYFSSVLPRPVLSSICDAAPYCVDFKRITICVPEDYSYVDDRYFLATLNVQIVALCLEPNEELSVRRILDDGTFPLISAVRAHSPILKCCGFAIIRAVDLKKKLFYVLTPVPLSKLAEVTIFARGTGLLVPQILLETQPASNVPYLSRPALTSKCGIISELYSGLKSCIH
ncbi:hypothetical protein DICVIV_12530 [Dictyocaulus viviparus]|uniref:NOL9 C-terminal domain-containing protein n=1 Tax=Dictyocaulus viviparus TaxID=29172 RepID=A0A0D8XGJ0_DICVI|nr:hypothetical protein DICVIV_12530 [Dictyocaulus viviparus]